jgi:hypothetical protein
MGFLTGNEVEPNIVWVLIRIEKMFFGLVKHEYPICVFDTHNAACGWAYNYEELKPGEFRVQRMTQNAYAAQLHRLIH